MKLSRIYLGLFFILCSLLTACEQQPQIAIYRTPKESFETADSIIKSAGPVKPLSLPKWTVPKSWEALPADGMRRASFRVTDSKKAVAEVSVVVLEGQSGTLLENVNRWRGQLNLEPISEEVMQSAIKSVRVSRTMSSFVDLKGLQGKSTLGVIVPLASGTWFFKLSGDTLAVEAHRKGFLEFLSSVTF